MEVSTDAAAANAAPARCSRFDGGAALFVVLVACSCTRQLP